MTWWLRAKLRFLYAALRSDQTDREIDDELRFHVELTIKENLEAGMSAADARKAALQSFGSIARIQESSREIRRGMTMDSIFQDLRNSLRLLRKHPGFSFLVIMTMALGIGANAAIFSVVESVLLKPLPYKRPMDLALIWSNFQKTGASRAPASGVQWREIRDRSRLLQDVAGIWVGNGTFTGDSEPEQVKIGDVTTNFFSVLGVHPALGRAFAANQEGTALKEVILSHGLWQRRFGGNVNIIGEAVALSGKSFTVVGVMPSDFVLAFPPDANVPMNIQAYIPFQENIAAAPRDLYYIRLLARLKPGVTIEQAQGEANSVAAQLRNEFKEYNSENLQLEVAQLHKDVVRDIKPALLALFVGAGLVLLICSFNVANLLLAHASTRRKEIALRAAIGASRWRIARQLLSESLTICFLGGAVGLGIGWIGLKLLLSIRPESLERIGTVSVNLPLLSFVSALSLGSGLLASLAPLLETRKVNLIEPLKEEGRSSSIRVKSRTRTLLIVSEMALGFVLLVGAGLMIRTLIQLHHVSPGFDPNHVLTFEIMPPGGLGAQRTNFVNQCEEKLAALPGVESVGAISHLPLDDYPNWYSPYASEGTAADQKASLLADHRAVTAGYFQAIGARLVTGRYFNELDDAKGQKVVIVDELLARQTWPSESALGKKVNTERFTDQGFENDWAEVVGVVEHIKGQSLLRPKGGRSTSPIPRERASI
jgi:predicted permease